MSLVMEFYNYSAAAEEALWHIITYYTSDDGVTCKRWKSENKVDSYGRKWSVGNPDHLDFKSSLED